ncbi:type II toxin-antitoxin system PemK/MazF family toxin [Chamaesiphon sp.]|uniref:type II toxin-antitoxin system PemK/MazF family toxin n=1 Tax=Chamaesiphon sp. TaxID=2814140 RepID=UPI0035937512
MTAQRIIQPIRGEIYLVNFDPTIGSEINKTRPALIIQNDLANENSPVTIIAAITSKFDDRSYPTEVRIDPPEGGLKTISVVLLNQIRTIDRQRLIRRIGALGSGKLNEVDRAIQISLGLIDL